METFWLETCPGKGSSSQGSRQAAGKAAANRVLRGFTPTPTPSKANWDTKWSKRDPPSQGLGRGGLWAQGLQFPLDPSQTPPSGRQGGEANAAAGDWRSCSSRRHTGWAGSVDLLAAG